MKIALYIFVGLVLLIMIAFFLLGKKSQNGTAPGLAGGRLTACSSKPNCVCSEDGAVDKAKIAALAIDSLDSLKTAIEASGGVITSSSDNYLSAEYTSGIFKFVDDVEARLGGGQVHIRSASRVGYSDNGVNRARVEALRAALK